MKIAILCREDFFRKFGGDTNQVLKYKKYWTSNGENEVDIITEESFPLDYDTYIIVNIDRFLETFYYLRKLKKQQQLNKVFVLCIHHNFDDVVFFESYIKKGISGYLAKKGGYFFRENIKDLILALKNRVFLASAFIELISNQKKFIDENKDVLNFIFLSEGERISLEKDFNVKLPEKNLIFTKNGCDLPTSFTNDTNSDGYDILVSGRIEPRKNQIRVIQDLCKSNYRICFVGASNENNINYYNRFIELVEKYDNIFYVGKVSPEEMHLLYRKSKIHISASWFEVSSLVDLEAYYLGCKVISSTNGYTKELLKNRVSYFDPRGDIDITDIVDSIINEPLDIDHEEYISKNHDWKSNSFKLLQDISQVLLEKK